METYCWVLHKIPNKPCRGFGNSDSWLHKISLVVDWIRQFGWAVETNNSRRVAVERHIQSDNIGKTSTNVVLAGSECSY